VLAIKQQTEIVSTGHPVGSPRACLGRVRLGRLRV